MSAEPIESKVGNVHAPLTWMPLVVSKPFVTTFRESSRDMIVVPLEFLKLTVLAGVVFRRVESTLDAKVAKISTELIKNELVFVVVLYPNVAMFSQALIELLSGFTR